MSTRAIVPEASLPLMDMLGDMPSAVRASMTRGFTVLENLPEEKRLSISADISKTVVDAGDTEISAFAASLGVDEETASAIFSAISLLVALSTSRKESAEQLAQGLYEHKLLSNKGIQPIAQIIEHFLEDKDQLSKSVRIGNLAKETLPSFRRLMTSVDVRVEIRAGKVGLAVPVVIAHLITDIADNMVSFQMTKADVDALAEKFASLQKDILSAETWAKDHP